MRVERCFPDDAPLLAHVMAAICAERLADAVQSPLTGVFTIEASGMCASIELERERAAVHAGSRPFDASLRASLGLLVAIASGESWWRPLASGRLRVRGNPLKLLRLLALLRPARSRP